MSEALKEKIRSLLALAASSNEHEAALALAHAQRLMDINRITELDLIGKKEEIIEDQTPLFTGGRIPGWKFRLACLIAEFNNCTTLKFKGGRKPGNRQTDIIVFGRPSDIEHTHYILAFVVLQLNRIASIACLGEGHRYYDSWYNGAISGIQVELTKARNDAVFNNPNLTKTTLVKFNALLEQVEKFMEDKYRVTYSKAKSIDVDMNAYNSGYKAGKNVDTSGQRSKSLGMK